MSGGVDSSVAAALLLRDGWQVTGVFMCLGVAGPEGESRGCCSPADAADARRVAQALGIDLHVLNLAGQFEPIIDHFAAEYAAGRTPNPCIHCNTLLKFGRLIDLADRLGIEKVATGHYARIVEAGGEAQLHRGVNIAKDQSYALFGIERARLGRVLLPLGAIADKQAVRDEARRLGLPVHDKPDSQEICFAPDDDYVEVLRARAPHALRAGEIGQRRGLGVAGGVPLYVTGIDAEAARVTIGPRDQTLQRRLTAARANWLADVPDELPAVVQIRYNHRGSAATVRRLGADAFEAVFDEPVHAITPGQAAVVYAGDRVLGGGWIEEARG